LLPGVTFAVSITFPPEVTDVTFDVAVVVVVSFPLLTVRVTGVEGPAPA
jgi:hypothetical protein